MAAEDKKIEKDEAEHRKGHGYVIFLFFFIFSLHKSSFPLIIDCDMQEEMSSEASDLCVTGMLEAVNMSLLIKF